MSNQGRAQTSDQSANASSATEQYALPRIPVQHSARLNADLKNCPGIARWNNVRLEDDMMGLTLEQQPETEPDPWFRSAKQQQLGERKAAEACRNTFFEQAKVSSSTNDRDQVGASSNYSVAHTIRGLKNMTI